MDNTGEDNYTVMQSGDPQPMYADSLAGGISSIFALRILSSTILPVENIICNAQLSRYFLTSSSPVRSISTRT